MEGQVWHGTTILSVRKNGRVVIAGDGQVTLGQTVLKTTACKVRRLGDGNVIAGFAGATADAFALFERLEAQLERHPAQLVRACVEMAKDWRTDRYLRRLEAMMAVADDDESLVLTGTGDVLQPDDGLIGIGSGGNYALAAARALVDRDDLEAEAIGLIRPALSRTALQGGAGLTIRHWLFGQQVDWCGRPNIISTLNGFSVARSRSIAFSESRESWSRPAKRFTES